MEAKVSNTSEFKLTEENIELARQISDKFNIKELKEKCEGISNYIGVNVSLIMGV